EEGHALSLWLGRWSRPVELETFRLTFERTPDGPSLFGWPDSILTADPQKSAVFLLGDPFTFPVHEFLKQVNETQRGLRVMGGMASGIRGAGQCKLILNETMHEHGAIGVVLRGETPVRSIVSQGCRPIGRHMVITRGHDNLIEELGGRPPLDVVRELF